MQIEAELEAHSNNFSPAPLPSKQLPTRRMRKVIWSVLGPEVWWTILEFSAFSQHIIAQCLREGVSDGFLVENLGILTPGYHDRLSTTEAYTAHDPGTTERIFTFKKHQLRGCHSHAMPQHQNDLRGGLESMVLKG